MTGNTHALRIALLVAAVAALVLVPASLAGKGGGGGKPGGGGTTTGGGTLNLVLLNSTDGQAHYGQQVTFEVSTTATTQPSVRLECFQGGTLVYTSSAGFYPEYPWPWARTFTLGSGAWTGGAANCTATMYSFNGRRYSDLKTLSFGVAA